MTRITLDYDFSSVPVAHLIGLADAAKLIPGRGKNRRINLHVLQRYANPNRGAPCARPGGGRVWVVLPTVYRSFKRFTTAAAVRLWQAECDRISSENPVPVPKGRTSRQAARSHERAMAELRERGVLE